MGTLFVANVPKNFLFAFFSDKAVLRDLFPHCIVVQSRKK